MTMNIFKAIDKKLEVESHYNLSYQVYDVNGNVIESNTLTDQGMNEIINIADNRRAATISFSIKQDYTSICTCNEMNVDYFIKSNIIELINTTKHFNMTRKHKRSLNKILN